MQLRLTITIPDDCEPGDTHEALSVAGQYAAHWVRQNGPPKLQNVPTNILAATFSGTRVVIDLSRSA